MIRGQRPDEAKLRNYRLSNGASPADPWNGKRERLPYKTRSLPTLTHCFPRSFTFYVAFPVSSIHRDRLGAIGRRHVAEFAGLVQVDPCRCQFRVFTLGCEVRHPQYGVGEVKSLTELTAEISFDDARRTIAPASSELTPAEPTAAVSELQVPLSNFIRETAHVIVEALGPGER